MTKTITIEGVGKTKLTDNDYLASGGQASVYVKGGLAIKIYEDQKQMIPVEKINELKAIKDVSVLKPKHIVYDAKSKPIGYAMDFKKNTHPLCKLFTKSFRKKNNISFDKVGELVMKGQQTVQNVHDANCRIVDLNELNVLASNRFASLFFIDVDSYQTPSYKADAIMESIRDRQIKDNKWTDGSDWFSFAILSFQMWVGIHPYKGGHPDYAKKDWLQRMTDGVSVFDPKATLPKACSPFSVIPPSHLKWYKEIFVNNARIAPPQLGDTSMLIAVPTNFNIKTAVGIFDLSDYFVSEKEINEVFNFMGISFYSTKDGVYKDKAKLPIVVESGAKTIFCETSSISPVVGFLKDEMLSIKDTSGKDIGEIAAQDAMYRNGCIYTIHGGKMNENSFVRNGDKVFHKVRYAANVMTHAIKAFDGVVAQDMLGKQHLTIPYEQGKVSTIRVKELDGYKILDAQSERNVCVVLGSKKGKYFRFVLTFSPDYDTFSIRIEKDVDYADVNLTVLPTGIAILATDDQIEIFKGANVKVVDNPPFDSSSRIFNVNGTLHYVEDNKIMTAKMKK